VRKKRTLGENFLKKGHGPTFSPNLFQKLLNFQKPTETKVRYIKFEVFWKFETFFEKKVSRKSYAIF